MSPGTAPQAMMLPLPGDTLHGAVQQKRSPYLFSKTVHLVFGFWVLGFFLKNKKVSTEMESGHLLTESVIDIVVRNPARHR